MVFESSSSSLDNSDHAMAFDNYSDHASDLVDHCGLAVSVQLPIWLDFDSPTSDDGYGPSFCSIVILPFNSTAHTYSWNQGRTHSENQLPLGAQTGIGKHAFEAKVREMLEMQGTLYAYETQPGPVES